MKNFVFTSKPDIFLSENHSVIPVDSNQVGDGDALHILRGPKLSRLHFICEFDRP